MKAGLYDYDTKSRLNQISIGYSYNLIVFSSLGAILSNTTYNLVASSTESARLASDLNNVSSDKVVAVVSYLRPKGNYGNKGLPEAMYRCGATKESYLDRMLPGTAYILIGKCGLGPGKVGYQAMGGEYDVDPNSELSVSFGINRDGSYEIFPRTYNILAAGTASISKLRRDAGIYDIDKNNSKIYIAKSGYNLIKIRKSSGAVVFNKTFDLSDTSRSYAVAKSFAVELQSINNRSYSDHILVLFTFKEPSANRLLFNIPKMIYRCGGTSQKFGDTTKFKKESAYALVGVCGSTSTGLEFYTGIRDSDADNSWLNIVLQVI